ncbi:antibiotic biosynthesis monooxygenase [Marinilongibacter aquaticus]|uniref:putative quinol monooxygenase n=1 Tax=Marinilongibacter aquaticus TaxID=2975157 RepID=UPI0021BDA168|nr:putative quinol monooxygenase [Marinilongibacter aquaticus]UBM59800.1 antibiotic biosynthesis monooxygenase [Marinilongibacter aquaticus]
MHKYQLHGKFKVHAENRERLAEILLEAAQLVSQAKGCLLYTIAIDPNDAEAVWVSEVWENKADHDNSLQFPGVRELIMQAMPLLDGPPEKGQELELLGGFGI